MSESSELSFGERFKAVAGDQPFAWGARHGLDKALVANCLRGKSRPQKKNLDKLVAATGIAEDWWLHGSLPPPGVQSSPMVSRLVSEDSGVANQRAWVRSSSRNTDNPRLRMALAMQLGRRMLSGGWCQANLDIDRSDRIISLALASIQGAYTAEQQDVIMRSEGGLDAALHLAFEAIQGKFSNSSTR